MGSLGNKGGEAGRVRMGLVLRIGDERGGPIRHRVEVIARLKLRTWTGVPQVFWGVAG